VVSFQYVCNVERIQAQSLEGEPGRSVSHVSIPLLQLNEENVEVGVAEGGGGRKGERATNEKAAG